MREYIRFAVVRSDSFALIWHVDKQRVEPNACAYRGRAPDRVPPELSSGRATVLGLSSFEEKKYLSPARYCLARGV